MHFSFQALTRKSLAILVPAISWSFIPIVAQGQTGTQINTLPNAPAVEGQSAARTAQPSGTGTLSGTVLDSDGDVIQGATVTLSSQPVAQDQKTKTGGDGQFSSSGLPAGAYKVKCTGPGMSTYTSPGIALQAGEFRIVPEIVLSVMGAATSVTVRGDQEELAQEQVQIAVQQRVLGVIPNFYSAYDWNAPPMGAKQKFHLSLRSMFDPVAFATVAGIAGAEQYHNVFPAYGGGLEGYGKRYGAAFANHVSGQVFGRAVYPSLFRQDPRYFYKGTGSVRSRALYAIASAVMARRDNGRWEPNYSAVLGNFTAGAISNLYYPESDRGASLVIYNGLADTGADAVGNLFREFVLKKFTSRAKNAGTSP